MNPRKMLALMGVRSPSLTRLMHRELAGVTVRHPLSPVDVAHALAYVSNRRAVGVYLATWCPGYAESRQLPALLDDLARMMLAEYRRRAAKDYHERGRGAGKWPRFPERWSVASENRLAGLRKMGEVALFELSHKADCEACHGFGAAAVFKTDSKRVEIVPCEACIGQGFLPYAKAMRAKMLRIRLDSYNKSLHLPYSWLYSELRRLEQEAADAHYQALRTDDPGDDYVEDSSSQNSNAASSARR